MLANSQTACPRTRLALVALGLLLSLVVLAVACNGKSDDMDAQKLLLERMILQPEDIAPDLERVTAAFSTNQDLADATIDPEKELSKLEGYERQLGYEVTYQPRTDAPSSTTVRAVSDTTSLYREAEGASASFEEAVETARTTDWLASHSDLVDVEVQEIELAGIGDEAMWTRVSGFQSEDRSGLVLDDFVLLRRDTVRAFLRVVHLVDGSAGNDASIEDVRGWATQQVQLIDAALTGSR